MRRAMWLMFWVVAVSVLAVGVVAAQGDGGGEGEDTPAPENTDAGGDTGDAVATVDSDGGALDTPLAVAALDVRRGFPAQIKVTRGGEAVRATVRLESDGEIQGLTMEPPLLRTSDGFEVALPDDAISGMPGDGTVAADAVLDLVLTIPGDWDAASGEYTGDLLLKFEGGRLTLPMTLTVRDGGWWPVVVLTFGVLVGLVVTLANTVWIPNLTLRGKIKELQRIVANGSWDYGLPNDFADKINRNLDRALQEAELLDFQPDAAQAALQQAETLYNRWYDDADNWRLFLRQRSQRQAALKKQREAVLAKGDVNSKGYGKAGDLFEAYALAIERNLESVITRELVLEIADLKPLLQTVTGQIHRFGVVIGEFEDLWLRYDTLTCAYREEPSAGQPTSDAGGNAAPTPAIRLRDMPNAIRNLMQAVNGLPPDDAAGLDALRTEVNALRMQMNEQLRLFSDQTLGTCWRSGVTRATSREAMADKATDAFFGGGDGWDADYDETWFFADEDDPFFDAADEPTALGGDDMRESGWARLVRGIGSFFQHIARMFARALTRPRYWMMFWRGFVSLLALGLLVYAGYEANYINNASFGANWLQDYGTLFVWGLGSEATRSVFVGVFQNRQPDRLNVGGAAGGGQA